MTNYGTTKKLRVMINCATDTNRLQIFFEAILRLIAIILSIFYDARIILHAVLFLILIDQVMGVTYALKQKKFSWQIFNKVYRKVITYILVIIAAFVYERYLLLSQELYFTKIIGALVGFQEISSAYLTFAKMTGIRVFETIFDKLRG
jgi:phage-related holin